jgi:3-oxoacyl-[acyl-carrier protein] reductase
MEVPMNRYAEKLDFTGKNVIVTGALSGAGREISRVFIESGANVILTFNHSYRGSEWFMENYPDRNMLFFRLDQSDMDSIAAFAEQIRDTGLQIDCLVNNAGIVYNRKIGMIMREETERMFLVNVIAVLELIQLCSRLMARNGGGSIVNISSVTAVLGSPGQVAYSATKGAIISMTKSAAKELAPQGIRVNAVAPGIVKTERFTELYESDGDKIDARIGRIALGRLGTPEDIAHACAFLASDRTNYISGQILGVDGCASI